MKGTMILAAVAATALSSTAVFASERIKLPTASAAEKPQMTTAVSHDVAPVTNVAWARRGYYGGYAPYRAYRPYYGGYGYGYGGYYTRPYYGYSYYGPGWGYGGWGPGVGIGVGRPWGPGIGLGVGPVARFGGGYW
jgi:hypothetical protein